MQLIVGLGNPGTLYAGTRHNVGFDVVDELARRGQAAPWRKKGKAEFSQVTIEGHNVLLAKPQTFMNLSGDSVLALSSFYKIPLDKVLVIHDELDFALARVRLKFSGGHGGHNGLRHIMSLLGPDFARLRFGIGRPRQGNADANFVLSRFGKSEQDAVAEATARSADAVALVCQIGLIRATEQVNRQDA